MFASAFYITGHAGGLSKLFHKCVTYIQKMLIYIRILIKC